MNQRILAVLLAGLVSANAWSADIGTRAPAGQPAAHDDRQPIADLPYSATQTLTIRRQQRDGGEFKRETVTKMYRDSEGRTRRDMLDSDGNSLHSIITDIDGTVLVLDHVNRTVSKGGVSRHAPVRRDARPAPLPRKSGTAPVVEQLGERDIEGMTATGKVTRHQIGAAGKTLDVATETWTAKELGLAMYVRNTDANGESVIAISDLERGEPDPLLFAAPEDYRRKP